MNSRRRSPLSRLRWAVAFALLLLAASAVPVLAEPPPPENPQVTPPPILDGYDPSIFPDTEDIAGGLDKAEAAQKEHQQWLEGPEAEQQRESSRLAYVELSATESENLLRTTFAELLANLNTDPARFLSDARLVSAGEDKTVATVKDEGDGMLMDSDMPVRTEDEDGDLRKVDLTLEQTAEGLETTNALSDVVIPNSAAAPVEVGEGGIGISLAGADGNRVPRLMGDENAFVPEVLPDTDMLVSPISAGVEVFNLLRSEQSPETFHYEVDMPPGAELRREDGWGVEVVKDEEILATIPEPTAVDAQGTDVPVELQIEGDFLVLAVDHREGDYAMPILLDPILEDGANWYLNQNLDVLGNWGFSTNSGSMFGSTSCIYECFYGGGRALYVSAGAGTFWPGQHAQWAYGAPNIHSYLKDVTLAPYNHFDHNCSEAQYPKPHNYFGIWSANLNNWVYLSVNSANQPGNSYTLPFAGDAVVFGLGTGGSSYSIPCWRDLRAGGSHIWLDDWNPPWIEGGMSGIHGIPGGWVSDQTPFTITAVAKDQGLGIKNVRIHHWGGNTIYDVPPQNECSGTRRSLCYTTHTASFDNIHGGYFFPGERDAWLSANDPTGRYTGDYHWTMRVDNSPPEMNLKGQFAEATNEVGSAEVPAGKGDQLSLPVYNLEIEAKDGSLGDPLNKRSGVKDIELWLDGVEQSVPWEPQPCPNSSCEMKKTYPVQLSKLTTSGKHLLKVEAVDHVGKRLKRELEFEYFPATGMKDEYVMHYFPLPDGTGNEAEEEHPDRPELAVNVMNGNLVYREQDVEVEAVSLDLEVERYYNSMLPENEETEWGDGWTLAQTPDLDPIKTGGSQVPNEAEILDAASVIEEGVTLPTAAGAQKFDPGLQATVTKKPNGGYELSDETGEAPGTIAFDATGQTEALLSGGYAKVDYSYEAGHLSEIAVDDPASTSLSPEEVESLVEEGEGEPAAEEDSQPSFAGQAAAGMPAMYDVAVDQAGDTWVIDRTYARVLKYSPAGQLLSYFGSEGTQVGKFKSPSGIAIDAEGFIWVADSGNNRVQKLTPNGSSMGSFGSYGSGEEQFIQPSDVAIDGEGNVWVADTGNSRLQKFGPWGEFLGAFGSQGSGDGEFLVPKALDVGPEGDVWVADTYNDRIQKLSPEGEHLLTSEAWIQDPEGIVVDVAGELWVSSASSHAIWHLDADGEELGEFGSYGSGEGLWLKSPRGLTVGPEDRLFIADTGNKRVVRWALSSAPERVGVAMGSFGAQGSGEGELSSPSSIAATPNGDVWVADTANSRIQRFNAKGQALATVGAEGSASGEFSWPMGIATDPNGAVWVADTGNGRIQHFGPEGEHVGEFGTWGEGPGEFYNVVALAIGSEGDLWTLDSGTYRVQHFDAEGNYLGQFGEYGSEKGQLMSPSGIAVDPDGNVWVADPGNLKVMKFSPEGHLLRTLKPHGEEPMPTGVEVDGEGNVWVAEGYGERIRGFTPSGRPLSSFGAESDEYALSVPYDLAVGPGGEIWALGIGNSVIQRWYAIEPSTPANFELPPDDPAVELETNGGLITSVEGEEAGEHTYAHEGDFLVSYDGPEGQTTYEKDPATGQLSKVTLPNGTWAKIKYHADKRVESVEVAPNGTSPKITYFHYDDGPPRQTTVSPQSQPQIVYDIAADGAVFKWWHKDAPPEIVAMTGNLWADRYSEIDAGDLVLEVEADSPHGLASVQIIANGDQLVSEKTCEQDPDPEIECERLEDLWVTDTASLAPGVLNLEVIATNELGKTASERWWVEIPRTPPPVPGSPVPPKFSEIQKFREDYGLEVVFPVATERELVERIFNLINAWHSPGTPAGEVARASMDRWGVPLRPEDVAEIEYRQWYVGVLDSKLEDWGITEHPGTYAGYYVDHPSGGIVNIGFTTEQAASLAAFAQQATPPAQDRLQTYPAPASLPVTNLVEKEEAISTALESSSTLRTIVTEIWIDYAENSVKVGAINVSQVSQELQQALGSLSGINIVYQPNRSSYSSGRNRTTGRMLAGDRIVIKESDIACTAGFGAYEKRNKKSNGEEIFAPFFLTSGHCFARDINVWRTPYAGFGGKNEWAHLGQVTRSPYEHGAGTIDVEAVRLKTDGLAPRRIYGRDENRPGFEDPVVGHRSQRLCFSGAMTGGVRCGDVVGIQKVQFDGECCPVGSLKIDAPNIPGDSGGPVWDPRTGAAVGILRGYVGEFTWVQPLLDTPNNKGSVYRGALEAAQLFDLRLMTGD
jgi:sugar lactone lactonase YvrE